ncbi:MAG: POTRA domain-containing protein, partial [Prolixibacteraceae bacterium]|nr:POTRA domain-containing protein [Prolixibacteraceae bacterium]
MKLQSLTILLSVLYLSAINLQSSAQENFEIRQIKFQGNKTVDKELLLDNMVLKGLSRTKKIFTKKEPSLYNEELMKADLERVVSIYQREGFLFAQASLQSLLVDDKKKTVKVLIEIEEGNPVITDSVEIKTIQDFPVEDSDIDIEKIKKGLSLTEGKRFRDEAVKADISFIEETFQNMGFAYAKVNYKLSLNPEENKTGIRYSVDTDTKSYLGETTISGNKNVTEKFI